MIVQVSPSLAFSAIAELEIEDLEGIVSLVNDICALAFLAGCTFVDDNILQKPDNLSSQTADIIQ